MVNEVTSAAPHGSFCFAQNTAEGCHISMIVADRSVEVQIPRHEVEVMVQSLHRVIDRDKSRKRIPVRLWVGKTIMDGEEGFSYSVTAADTTVSMSGAYQTEIKCDGGFWIEVEERTKESSC